MTEVKELNAITNELLLRIEDVKKNIKSSMMKGEVNILKGVVIFEVILKELNPSVLDEKEIDRLEECIRRYLIEKEEQTQHVDAYVHYGVNRCFLVLESYRPKKENEKKRRLTKK